MCCLEIQATVTCVQGCYTLTLILTLFFVALSTSLLASRDTQLLVQLENVQWISNHCKSAIRSRGATWRVMFDWKNYRHPGIAIADTVAKDDFLRWIAGKRYIPQQKSPRKDKSLGCPLADGKSVGVAEHFPWPVGWAQTGYPKEPQKDGFSGNSTP